MRAPRSAAFGAFASLFLLATLVGGSPRPAATPAPLANLRPAAAVAWPPSAGLLVAEVVTGGASASDEYVEITNAGPAPADLAGMELAYVTSSGSTVTRKATWSQLTLLAHGQHLLVANALGSFAATADATYAGGLAATGGSLVLRPVGGMPVDAVGWGDATNPFVEGAAAPAPPAGQSIERRPGGSGGNVTDTNQNAADWAVLTAPLPQNLAADPVPGPSASPTPTPIASPSPTPDPDPSPSPVPSPSPSPSPTPEPSPTPTPTPTPTPEPSPTPTPTPVPIVSIGVARTAPDGTSVTVEGVLSTPLGLLEDGRSAFLQDDATGIAIYAASAADPMPAGSLVRVAGVVDDRYGQRTIRTVDPPTLVAPGAVPSAREAATGAAVEALESLRILVHGTVIDSPTILADGPAVSVDDGSGPLRVIFAGAAGPFVPARGSLVSVAGSLGQRDSSGTGAAGYRLFVVDPLDVTEEPSPTPTPSEEPSPSPSPDPSATPSPSPTSTPSPTPIPAPSPTPAPTDAAASIETARSASVGTTVRVRGTVTAEPGRVGLPPLGVVADETGAIFVRFPDGVVPARGALVEVVGRLFDPYGQLEIRPASAGVRLLGAATPALPLPIGAASLGELVEARLVTLEATLDAAIVRESGGDLVLRLRDAAGAPFVARATRPSGLQATVAQRGDRLRLVGIVGQRASARGALVGYRLWLRDAGDLTRSAGAAASPTPSPGATATPRPGTSEPPVTTIAAAIGLGSGSVAVEGIVTVASTLLDATGRRSIVQDTTAAIEVLVPRDASAPRPGDRVRVVGTVGRAYGAPRVTAATLTVLGHAAEPDPAALAGPPSVALEWRLVIIEGTVTDQRRLGDRWRAEVGATAGSIPVAGLPGAGIPATALVEGSRVRIVGIVRRPNPAATDQHFVVVPRSLADIRVLARAGGSTQAAGSGPGSSGSGASSSAASRQGGTAAGIAAPVSADIADLAGLAGRAVRVGGLVAAVDATGLVLDDGTGTVRLDLADEVRSLLSLLGPGDAVGAAGVVAAGTPPTVRVTDAADLVRLGDLGEPLPLSDDVVTADDARVPPSEGPGARSPSLEADSTGVAGNGALAPVTSGAGSIGALATAGGMLLLVRRRRDRRILEARIARRIAGIGAPFTAATLPEQVGNGADPAPPPDAAGPVVRESA